MPCKSNVGEENSTAHLISAKGSENLQSAFSCQRHPLISVKIVVLNVAIAKKKIVLCGNRRIG